MKVRRITPQLDAEKVTADWFGPNPPEFAKRLDPEVDPGSATMTIWVGSLPFRVGVNWYIIHKAGRVIETCPESLFTLIYEEIRP